MLYATDVVFIGPSVNRLLRNILEGIESDFMTIQKITLTALGGLSEIGALNCMVYETDDEAILIDCGSMFPDNETLGVDLIIPDFSYLESIKHKLKGIVFTHGHEDHIGAIPYLLKNYSCPVYATPFTAGLITEKLKEYPLKNRPQINIFEVGEKIEVGNFEIESFLVNHSIPDACGLAIKTKSGYVIHLTDWKIDKTPYCGQSINLKKLSQFSKKGVLALLSDSTNAGSPGFTLSEKQIFSQIKKICKKHNGRVIVTLFSSNIERVQALADIAKEHKRNLALVGRSMKENTEIARKLGRLTFNKVEVLDIEETKNMPDKNVMILVTGTQGEPRSVLTRMAADQFKACKIKENDLVLFSARMIPGNERNVSKVINNLCRQKARVLYEGMHEIHTSGHAHQEELKKIIKIFKPKYFFPIHGEYRNRVRHSELAQDCNIPLKNIAIVENGQQVHFSKSKMEFGSDVPAGRVFIDGLGVGDVSDEIVRDRRKLAHSGLIICNLMIDRKTGDILRGPELITKGFVEEKGGLIDKATIQVTEFLKEFNKVERTDMAEMQEEVRLCIRRFFRRELDVKPVVIPVIQEV